MKRFYIYEHRDVNDKLFYIGKGTGDRYMSSDKRFPKWKEIAFVNGLVQFKPKILIEGLSEKEAYIKEQELIKEIGYENLCNICPRERQSHRMIPIVGTCLLTGEKIEFKSLKSAYPEFSPGKISGCLKGDRKSHKGYKWEKKFPYNK